MPGSRNTHRIEIPEILYEHLNRVAVRAGQPTSQMIGTWLWEELNRRAHIPGDPAHGLGLAERPYRNAVRAYPRRND